MATTQHKNACPGGHKIRNFGRPILGHDYCKLSLSETCPQIIEKIFKENSVLPFLPQNYRSFGWDVMEFTISCLLSIQMLGIKIHYNI